MTSSTRVGWSILSSAWDIPEARLRPSNRWQEAVVVKSSSSSLSKASTAAAAGRTMSRMASLVRLSSAAEVSSEQPEPPSALLV